MHIYCFGSIARGEMTKDSDIDLLAIIGDEKDRDRLDSEKYLIYSYDKLADLWKEGSRFAWLIHTEAKLIFSDDGKDFVKELKVPSPYARRLRDSENFYLIFKDAQESILGENKSTTFDLSTIFFAIRSFAISYSMREEATTTFSRRSSLKLGDKSLPITENVFEILNKARLLATRGYGNPLNDDEIKHAIESIPVIDKWMGELLEEMKNE